MARSPLTDESLREKLRPFLMTVKGTDAAVVEEFLERCSYRPVATYDDVVRFDLFDLCQMQYQIYYRWCCHGENWRYIYVNTTRTTRILFDLGIQRV